MTPLGQSLPPNIIGLMCLTSERSVRGRFTALVMMWRNTHSKSLRCRLLDPRRINVNEESEIHGRKNAPSLFTSISSSRAKSGVKHLNDSRPVYTLIYLSIQSSLLLFWPYFYACSFNFFFSKWPLPDQKQVYTCICKNSVGKSDFLLWIRSI